MKKRDQPLVGKPLIGITAGTDKNPLKHPELYVKAVEKAGGSAVFLSPALNVIDLSADYDGFLIPGGKDLNPLLYNENQRFENKPEEAQRIDFEKSLLHEIINSRKPVLGICYGMQLINVFLKGTLYQDISSQITGSIDHKESGHIVKIEYNPYIEKGMHEVNSSHHQAIKDTGQGIKPFAYASDGIIEAFYLENYDFLMGLQWHPERIDNTISRQVFEAFIAVSALYQSGTGPALSRSGTGSAARRGERICRGGQKRGAYCGNK